MPMAELRPYPVAHPERLALVKSWRSSIRTGRASRLGWAFTSWEEATLELEQANRVVLTDPSLGQVLRRELAFFQ